MPILNAPEDSLLNLLIQILDFMLTLKVWLRPSLANPKHKFMIYSMVAAHVFMKALSVYMVELNYKTTMNDIFHCIDIVSYICTLFN